MNIVIRPHVPEDLDFILSTWKRGLYYGNSWFREIDKEVFMGHYGKIIEDIVNFPSTIINVAVLDDDTNIILGYCVTSKAYYFPVLHWIFVKSVWRKMGIARRLLPETIDTVTHMTDAGKRLKPKHVKFNPFLI